MKTVPKTTKFKIKLYPVITEDIFYWCSQSAKVGMDLEIQHLIPVHTGG